MKTHGFVGIENRSYSHFTSAYQELKYDGIPVFVTSDSMLHTYHNFFDTFFMEIEEERLIDLSRNLTMGMLEECIEQYGNASGTYTFTQNYEGKTITETVGLKEAARKNVAYFSVALKLIDPNAAIPNYVEDLVNSELELIHRHDGMGRSPIFDKSITHPLLEYWEDYTQYKPRGHYTHSENLERYFQEMMWYGRMSFRVKSAEETIQAILISNGMNNAEFEGIPVSELWYRIYEITAYFVGNSDDLTFLDYLMTSQEIYGMEISDYSILGDSDKLDSYRNLLKELRAPRICSSLVNQDQEDVINATTGFRFMGQRFIPDSYIFQELVFPKVKTYIGAGSPFTLSIDTQTGQRIRGIPRGLDVMGILGSEIAEDYLIRDGDASYENYSDQFQKLKQDFLLDNGSAWSQNLYWGWLYTLKSLNENFSAKSYPTFMKSRAWRAEKLNTQLASWAQLRHDTLLYGKAGATPNSMGLTEHHDGYVEPIPTFFSRLADLTTATKKGLSELSLLSDSAASNLTAFSDLLIELKDISVKELNDQELNWTDLKTIRFIGDTLEEMRPDRNWDELSTRIVADVHTDPSKDPRDGISHKCLEEGVGYVNYIICVVKRPNGTYDAVAGPIFSHYEFRQKASERLTDEEWREMLQTGDNVPPKFDWMDYPPKLGPICEVEIDIGLGPEDISFSNQTVYGGDGVDISANVHNRGNVHLNGTIEFFNGLPPNNVLLQRLEVFLPLKRATAVTIEWNTTNEELGIHNIYVSIACQNQTEITTSNNYANKNLTIILRDLDGDGIGDDNDTDIDGDGWDNSIEMEAGTDPYNHSSFPSDIDGDRIPDVFDEDIDGDGWNNTIEMDVDTDPYDPLSNPNDLDGDRIPDVFDDDIDGDGWGNSFEAEVGTDPHDNSSFPSDTDGDGILDKFDGDDDNDGYSDIVETVWNTDPLNKESYPLPPVWLEIPSVEFGGCEFGMSFDLSEYISDNDTAIENLVFSVMGYNDSCIHVSVSGYILNIEQIIRSKSEVWLRVFDGLHYADTNISVVANGTGLPLPPDIDNDGIPDAEDNDIDNDGFSNIAEELCGTDPYDNRSFPPDMDDDGMPDSLDPDRDGDGVDNEDDLYPDDGGKWEEVGKEGKGISVWLWVVGIILLLLVLGIVGRFLLLRENEMVEIKKEEDVGKKDNV